MKTLFSVRIPSICVCFTLSALFMAASDLLAGNFPASLILFFPLGADLSGHRLAALPCGF